MVASIMIYIKSYLKYIPLSDVNLHHFSGQSFIQTLNVKERRQMD